MTNFNFSFLKDVELAAVPEGKSVSKSRTSVSRPDGMALRVYKNGRVLPSEQFEKEYSLEYAPINEEISPVDDTRVIKTKTGNGLDFVASDKWNMTASLGFAIPVLFVSVVPRTESKIDLWGSCSYNEEGEPKSSILTQKASFGPALVLEVERVYGEMTEGGYIDLLVDITTPMVSPNQIYFFDKASKSRKTSEVTMSYVRRELIDIYPLIPAAVEEAPIIETITEDMVENASPETPVVETPIVPAEAVLQPIEGMTGIQELQATPGTHPANEAAPFEGQAEGEESTNEQPGGGLLG